MPSLPQTPGLHTLTFSDGQRYTVSIPASYTGHKPVPFILALHWGGPPYPYVGQDLLVGLIEPALEDLDAIMLAPDCRHGDWNTPQSEADVLALLAHLKAGYNLDPQRTLVTGYSKGGIGTWYLAARHQDKFTAALPISALPVPEALDVNWRIPLYVIHSRLDEVFPFARTKTVVEGLRARGVSVGMHLLDGITHYDVDGFVSPLRAALPWIRRAWGSDAENPR